MPKVIFTNNNRIVDVERGTSVLEAALTHHIDLFHTCGGNCSCSTCRILVLKGAENLSPMAEDEAGLLDSFDLRSPHRLGCQSLVLEGTVEIRIPDRTKSPRPNKTPPVPDA